MKIPDLHKALTMKNGNESKPSDNKKLNFSYLQYLAPSEKLIFFLSLTTGIVLTSGYIYATIKELRSGETIFGASELLVLALAISPLALASKMHTRGMERIPTGERAPFDEQNLEFAKQFDQQLSSTVKSFAIWGTVTLIISIILIAGFIYYFYSKTDSISPGEDSYPTPRSTQIPTPTPLTNFSTETVRVDGLVIENFTLTEESGWYAARGTVKNMTDRYLQPVMVKITLLDEKGKLNSSSESMISRRDDGLLKPGSQGSFESKFSIREPYADYTYEVYVKCQTTLPCYQ